MIDRATWVGLSATLALIAWVMLSGAGGDLAAFWQAPSAALVLGGATLTTLIAFPWERFRAAWAILRNAMTVRTTCPEGLIATLVSLAHVARKDGLLALERPAEAIEDDFLKRALRMAIDGSDAGTIERICRTELEATDIRHATGSSLVESIGRAALVFGMLGTVIGLIVMLGRVNEPAQIGPGMAVALSTTLYGLLLANVLCLPLARKLTYRSSEELLGKTIALQGVLAIQAGDNPRVVEQKLRAYLPAGTTPASSAEPAKSAIARAATLAAPASQRSAGRLRRSLLQAARLNPFARWPRRIGRKASPAVPVEPAGKSRRDDKAQTLAGAA